MTEFITLVQMPRSIPTAYNDPQDADEAVRDFVSRQKPGWKIVGPRWMDNHFMQMQMKARSPSIFYIVLESPSGKTTLNFGSFCVLPIRYGQWRL